MSNVAYDYCKNKKGRLKLVSKKAKVVVLIYY